MKPETLDPGKLDGLTTKPGSASLRTCISTGHKSRPEQSGREAPEHDEQKTPRGTPEMMNQCHTCTCTHARYCPCTCRPRIILVLASCTCPSSLIAWAGVDTRK
ncbi:hypothetical protein V8C34DRAFT_272627 [Trichoderma compactum]